MPCVGNPFASLWSLRCCKLDLRVFPVSPTTLTCLRLLWKQIAVALATALVNSDPWPLWSAVDCLGLGWHRQFAGAADLQLVPLHLILVGVDMAFLASLLPGQTLAVFYSDDVVWHERLLLWQLKPGFWFILTPDQDLYAEDLRIAGGDGPSKVKIKGHDFRYWSRVGGTAYRFAAPISDDQKLKGYIRQAFQEGLQDPDFDRSWRPENVVDCQGVLQPCQDFLRDLDNSAPRRRITGKGGVLQPAGQLPAGVVVKPIEVAGDDKIWLAMERIDSIQYGDTVDVNPDSDIMIGERTGLVKTKSGWAKVELVDIASSPEFLQSRKPGHVKPDAPAAASSGEAGEESSGDARTLFVDFDEQNVRYKEWRQVVQECVDYNYEDWPHSGPATVHHLLKHFLKYGGDPKQWLELWCRQKGIADQDRVKHELRCLMEVFQLAGTYDQLNLPVLASMETVARRVQCIVDAYAVGGASNPDWGNAKLFTGYVGPDDLVMPQLKTWAARKGKEEVELYQARNRMKELRKATSPSEEAAAAVADGNLPSGGGPKPKRRAKGKGLEPPAASWAWRREWELLVQVLLLWPLLDLFQVLRAMNWRCSSPCPDRHHWRWLVVLAGVAARDWLDEWGIAMTISRWSHLLIGCMLATLMPSLVVLLRLCSCVFLDVWMSWLGWRALWIHQGACRRRRQPSKSCSMGWMATVSLRLQLL